MRKLKKALAKSLEKAKSANGRNMIISSLSAIINPIIQIASTPIFFKALGAEGFGIWILLNSVLAVSGVFGLD